MVSKMQTSLKGGQGQIQKIQLVPNPFGPLNTHKNKKLRLCVCSVLLQCIVSMINWSYYKDL